MDSSSCAGESAVPLPMQVKTIRARGSSGMMEFRSEVSRTALNLLMQNHQEILAFTKVSFCSQMHRE